MSLRPFALFALSLPFALSGCMVDEGYDVDYDEYDTVDSELASNAISLIKSPAPQPPNMVGDWTGEVGLRELGDIWMDVTSQNARQASGTIGVPAALWAIPEIEDELVFTITMTAAASGKFNAVGTPAPELTVTPWPDTYWPTLQINGDWDGPTSSPDFDGLLHIESTNLRRNNPSGIRVPNSNGVRVPSSTLIVPVAMDKG